MTSNCFQFLMRNSPPISALSRNSTPMRAHQIDFLLAVGGTEFIFGDAVSVQAAGQRTVIKIVTANPRRPKFGGAGQRSGAGADAGYASGACRCCGGQAAASANKNNPSRGVAGVRFRWAACCSGASRTRLRTAHPQGTRANNSGPECWHSRIVIAEPRRLPRGDFLDEAWNIDVSGAGDGARRVETKQAARGFHQCGLRLRTPDEYPRTLARIVRRSCVTVLHELRLHQIAVHIGAPVAEKLPGLADFFDHVQIQIGGQHFIFVARGLGDNLAARIAEITRAVKFADIPRRFHADAVDGADEISIGDGVRGLFEFPKIFAQARRRWRRD